MRPAILLGLSAFVVHGAHAQAPPEVADILKQVGETYQGVTQYELVSDVTTTDPKTGNHVAVHMRVALRAPDRYRFEGAFPGTVDDNSSRGVNIFYDGATITFHDPKLNKYATYPASVLGDALPDDMEPDGVDFYVMERFRKAADPSNTPRFLREETIEIGSVKIACNVVSMKRGPAYTWWVDKKSNRVVREDRDNVSTVYTAIKLNEPLADSLFKFVPPPGARKNELKP